MTSPLWYKLRCEEELKAHFYRSRKMSKLPQTPAGWVSLVVFVVVAAVTAWQASKGEWVPTALGALGALGTAINRGVFPNDKQ
jgi:hypothetical protein